MCTALLDPRPSIASSGLTHAYVQLTMRMRQPNLQVRAKRNKNKYVAQQIACHSAYRFVGSPPTGVVNNCPFDQIVRLTRLNSHKAVTNSFF